MNTTSTPNQPPKLVYTVVPTKNGRSAWIKLGAGWVNTDGSLNLKLDALPVNGTMQVRDNDRDQRFEDRSAGLERPDLRRPELARAEADPLPSREAFA
jgi:hypothetical protein